MDGLVVKPEIGVMGQIGLRGHDTAHVGPGITHDPGKPVGYLQHGLDGCSPGLQAFLSSEQTGNDAVKRSAQSLRRAASSGSLYIARTRRNGEMQRLHDMTLPKPPSISSSQTRTSLDGKEETLREKPEADHKKQSVVSEIDNTDKEPPIVPDKEPPVVPDKEPPVVPDKAPTTHCETSDTERTSSDQEKNRLDKKTLPKKPPRALWGSFKVQINSHALRGLNWMRVAAHKFRWAMIGRVRSDPDSPARRRNARTRPNKLRRPESARPAKVKSEKTGRADSRSKSKSTTRHGDASKRPNKLHRKQRENNRIQGSSKEATVSRKKMRSNERSRSTRDTRLERARRRDANSEKLRESKKTRDSGRPSRRTNAGHHEFRHVDTAHARDGGKRRDKRTADVMSNMEGRGVGKSSARRDRTELATRRSREKDSASRQDSSASSRGARRSDGRRTGVASGSTADTLAMRQKRSDSSRAAQSSSAQMQRLRDVARTGREIESDLRNGLQKASDAVCKRCNPEQKELVRLALERIAGQVAGALGRGDYTVNYSNIIWTETAQLFSSLVKPDNADRAAGRRYMQETDASALIRKIERLADDICMDAVLEASLDKHKDVVWQPRDAADADIRIKEDQYLLEPFTRSDKTDEEKAALFLSRLSDSAMLVAYQDAIANEAVCVAQKRLDDAERLVQYGHSLKSSEWTRKTTHVADVAWQEKNRARAKYQAGVRAFTDSILDRFKIPEQARAANSPLLTTCLRNESFDKTVAVNIMDMASRKFPIVDDHRSRREQLNGMVRLELESDAVLKKLQQGKNEILELKEWGLYKDDENAKNLIDESVHLYVKVFTRKLKEAFSHLLRSPRTHWVEGQLVDIKLGGNVPHLGGSIQNIGETAAIELSEKISKTWRAHNKPLASPLDKFITHILASSDISVDVQITYDGLKDALTEAIREEAVSSGIVDRTQQDHVAV